MLSEKNEAMLKEKMKKTRWRVYSYEKQKAKAKAAQKSIESYNGKLSSALSKRAEEYAKEILGWKGHAPWLKVYAAFRKEFKDGWIPNEYFGHVVAPQINGTYGSIAQAKALSSKLLGTSKLPDMAYYVNGLFYYSNWEPMLEEDVEKHIFSDSSKVVYKTDSSCQGKGVFIISKKNFNIGEIRKKGNGVFQKFIIQHEFFEGLVPNSVANLRITSVIEDSGRASCRASFLKIAQSGKDTHVKSASDIIIPVEVSTGELNDKGYLPNWHPVEERHPDTNTLFAGRPIPNFNECVEFITKTHQENPFSRVVGWDIAIDKDGEIQVMEWNGRFPGVKFSEATKGPCFADLGWEKLHKTKR